MFIFPAGPDFVLAVFCPDAVIPGTRNKEAQEINVLNPEKSVLKIKVGSQQFLVHEYKP